MAITSTRHQIEQDELILSKIEKYFGADFLKKRAARLEELQQQITAKYGQVADDDLFAIEKAEKELAECRGCEGEPCRKSLEANTYFVPVIRIIDGRAKIAKVLCQVGYERKCRKSGLPRKYTNKTFSDYEKTADNAEALKIALAYAKKKPDASLYFYGGTGTGKTFLASLIAQEYIRDFKSVTFGDVPSLLDEIKRTFGTNESAVKVLDKYNACELLVLDDFGVGQITEWNVGQLYQMINSRYNAGKPVIVTSNYDFKSLEGRLKLGSDDMIARRIVSRLKEMCVEVFFGVKDRRV